MMGFPSYSVLLLRAVECAARWSLPYPHGAYETFSYTLGLYVGSRMHIAMITTIFSWRCECGARIGVIGESEGDNPAATSVAECPQCGDERLIRAVGKI